MNKQEFTHLLKNYNELNSEHIAMLKDIVKEYPYFSSANVLLAKAMSNDKHYEYEKQLKSTALITGDRSVLYKIINNIPLQSIEQALIIAEIPTALRVEKISKPDFMGVEEELPIIEETQIEFSSKPLEEEQIHVPSVDVVSPMVNIVEEIVPINVEVKNENETSVEEIPTENVESIVEPETNHLTKWNSFEHPFESEEKVELNEVEMALDEELRNEARSIIKESRQSDLVSDVVENVDLIPEDSLAEATGTMLRFENNRDENSLINLDDDDMLMDFDFGSLEDENVNQTLNQNIVSPTIIGIENLETHEQVISNSTDSNEEIVSEKQEIIEESPEPFVVENEEFENSITDSISDIPPTEAHTITDIEETAEIDETPDPFANPEEEQINANKQEKSALSLENLLDFEEEVERKEEQVDEPLSNWTEENMANFQQVFDEPEVSDIQEQITLHTEEFQPIVEVENHIEPENNIAENEVIVEEPIQVITSVQEENQEEHGFMDWLAAKKERDLDSVSHVDSTENINDFTKEEDDEFTLTIRQLIKERAEKSSQNKIESIQNEKESVAEFENVVSTENIEETIPEFSNNETQEENSFVEEKTEEVHPFYDYKVESVLPDFEQMVFHDVSDEESNDNASELQVQPSFEEKLVTDEVKLVFHPIHGLVPAGFDDESIKSGIENKDKHHSEEPIIEPWTEFNESMIVQNEETEMAANSVIIKEDELLAGIGEIQIDSNTDLSDEEEYELPVFDEVSFSDADFDKGFSSQFVPLTKAAEPTEVFEPEADLEIFNEEQTPENIITEPKVVVKDEKVESIIDKFIRENPNISRPKAEFYNPSNMAKMSAEEDDDLVSETLANVYLGQGLIKKAISTYEKLGLIYPHKMSYFAALINQLKTTHKIE